MDNQWEASSAASRPRVPQYFTDDEAEAITRKLDAKLEADEISYRQSAQGMNVAYVEGWRIIAIANEVFGFNGWCSEILMHQVDFVDTDATGKISTGISCRVRVSLKDGIFHDDIGYGIAENQRSKAAAFEKAKKESVTDAVKRALRQFGDRLGNCTYDKVFLRDVKLQQGTASSGHLLPQGALPLSSNQANQQNVAPAAYSSGGKQPHTRPPIRPPPSFRPPALSDAGLADGYDMHI